MLDVCAGIGAELVRLAVDPVAGRATRVASVKLPASVQYGWMHPTLPVLYVACAQRGNPEQTHACIATVGWTPEGDLTTLFSPVALPSRPIHLSADLQGRTLYVVFNDPPGILALQLDPSGRAGDAVGAPVSEGLGVYPHQVRVSPTRREVVVVSRGWDATQGHEPVRGRLTVLSPAEGNGDGPELIRAFDFDGLDGVGSFQARHLDFHPFLPVIYLVLESQSRLLSLNYVDGEIDEHPHSIESTLADTATVAPRQAANAVHVHPNGRAVYVSNRGDATEDLVAGLPRPPGWVTPEVPPVFHSGDNSIAHFAVDPVTGAATLVGTVPTQGFAARTFGISRHGAYLVTGNMKPMSVREGETTSVVPASLSIFTIGEAGALTFVAATPVDVGNATMEWSQLL